MEVYMTKKLILLGFIAFAIIIGGCSKESPVAPDLTGNHTGETLAKQTVTIVNFTFDEGKPEYSNPGTQWIDEDGILHIRGQVGDGAPIAGDFDGKDLHNVFNADINTKTGNGRFNGIFSMEVTWTARKLTGIFSGSYQGVFNKGLLHGTTVAFGEGDFDGMVLRIRQEGDAPVSYFLTATGTVCEHN
jgi:hypothetical protein